MESGEWRDQRESTDGSKIKNKENKIKKRYGEQCKRVHIYTKQMAIFFSLKSLIKKKICFILYHVLKLNNKNFNIIILFIYRK